MDISQIINELSEDRENYFNAIAPVIFLFDKTFRSGTPAADFDPGNPTTL